jgi:hypothetical protein
MVSQIAVQRRRHGLGLLVPALVVGAGVGTVVGGIAETLQFPVVGTFFGAVEGGVAGSAAGLLIGLLLIGIEGLMPAQWHAPRPLRLSLRPGGRSAAAVLGRAAAVLGRAVAIGAIGGGGLGAIAGLVVGLATHPPTAPFAVIEGGILCAVSGVVVSLPIAAAVLAARLRARR